MGGLPSFPINGSVISTGVTNDRLSLVVNEVANDTFPAGQYVFYTKNSSIWYKYKTATTAWTNEFPWISNASQSNVKFDANGYPVTAYIAPNGTVNVVHYDAQGNILTNTVAITGFMPTVAINNLDVYVFFVPPNFTNFILCADTLGDFSIIHSYPVSAPGQIESMQIEFVSNDRFLFTFEIDTDTTQQIYIGFTDPAIMLMAYDVQAFVYFT